MNRLSESVLGPDNQPTLYQRTVADSNGRDSEWLAKAALIGFGAHGLGKAFGKNLYADAANRFSSITRAMGKYVKQADLIPDFIQRGVPYSVGKGKWGAELENGIKLSSMSLVQDIAAAHYVLDDPARQGVRTQLKTTFAKHFQALGNRSGAQPSLHVGMKGVTIGDVLSDAANVDFYETKLLKSAISKGWLTENALLDPNLYRSASGKLMDTRMLQPSHALGEISKTLFDPFGAITSLRSFTKNARTVGIVSSRVKDNTSALFVGGNVYDYQAGALVKTASGKTLGAVNDARYMASLLRESPELITKTQPTNFFEQIQEATGVGPAFHDRRTGLFQITKTFFQNLKAIATGEGVLYGHEYKYAHESAIQTVLEPYVYSGTTGKGNTIVKGKFAGKRFLELQDLRGDNVLGIPLTGRVRGVYRRFAAYAGLSSDASVVSREAMERASKGGPPISKDDLIVKYGRSGIKSTEKVIGKGVKPTAVTLTGDLDKYVRPSDYAASADPVDRIYDFANWMTVRLNKLTSSSLLGIGFRPSGNLLANTARVAAIPMLYHFGKEAAMYGNYMLGQVLGQGPLEYAADIYTNMRVGQQKAREKLGITAAADKFENRLFPGLDLGVLGSIGAGIAGALTAEKKGVIKGLLAFAGLYGAIGGPNVAQSSQSLQNVYSGEEKVAVRKNRWWLLGYQPFKGGQIDYYKPSWYTEFKSKAYDVNLYGSESGYWRYGSSLPTPSNMFGLRNLIDPYHVERMNYYDRPYPTTAKMFENVPIFGPVLADTIGEIIKPVQRMHGDSQSTMIASSNISQRSVPTNAAKELGIPDVPVSAVNLSRPDILKDRLQKYANIGLEPTGLWKFALGLFGVTFDQEYKLASANNMTSPGRRFYEANLGGLFGETEFLRRFMLAEYDNPASINRQINPISNTMPRWLPGADSEYQGDRQYFTDFTKGDAYTKIAKGEYRLPGRGYESVNRLYSGTSGVYSDVDKYLILADVAPYSEAYYHFEGIVNKTPLDPYWRNKVTQAQNQRKNKSLRFEFESNSTQDNLAHLNEFAITRNIRKAWTGISQEGLSNIPIVGAKLFPYKNAYDQYLSDVVEGDTFADWRHPYQSIVRPALYSTIGENPLFATKRGFQMGALVSSPAAAFLQPFPIVSANPVQSTIAGAAIGGLGSTVRMLATGSLSHGWVPPHVKKERETAEYFDKLKYAKYRHLQGVAEEEGNKKLASVFASQARQTVTYGEAQFATQGSIAGYEAALDRDQRPYFDAFINAPSSSRNKILKVVPEHMGNVLQGIWKSQGASELGNPNQFADTEAVDYFNSHTLPGEDWAGWSPSVPEQAIRVKALDSHINGVSDNFHRFGIYPAQVQESRVRFPTLDTPSTNIHDTTSNIALQDTVSSSDKYGNPFVNVSHKRTSYGVGPRVDWFTAQVDDSRRDRTFAFYSDAYR